jgi:oxalate decarboxylase/phosphoglucose isomerase-like protein (cupin superfamily)
LEGFSRHATPPGVPTTEPAGVQLLTFRKIPDPRGNLTPVEGERDVPFAIRRVYWIYDVPGGTARGGHAYRSGEELFVALSGSFELTVDEGRGSTVRHVLNRSYYGVYVPALTWRRLENFSTNGVCLVLASQPYDEADYLRDYEEFRAARARAQR